MARLYIDDGELVVALPWRWALAARRRTVHLPPQCVDEVRNEPHWWRVVRPRPERRCRFRPGRWCVGELEHARGRDFVALRTQGPVLVISTFGRDAPYARLALSTDDHEAAASRLRQAAAESAPQKIESQVVNFPAALYIRSRREIAGTIFKEG
ncbi:hypothetical protein [Streptomyces sp. MK37H]|uniref:hypothetical protein n=1 Tax=Streptomyces sp. MK37H TaxID=2699117 RepID=UPI001B375905|nr:hypothetical protein [Streptomyces sp. MK37H]